MRIGVGYDVHRFAGDRPLILGGVRIPYHRGLDGHSDADVLTHAIIDALLGAAALGDIGAHFPDTDDRWKGAHSVMLLQEVALILDQEGYRVINIDASVSLQQPKLRPHINAMRKNIAEHLGIAQTAVSVKATTTEQLGFVGREEGASAHAVCLIETT